MGASVGAVAQAQEEETAPEASSHSKSATLLAGHWQRWRAAWQAGESAVGGWLAVGEAAAAEGLAAAQAQEEEMAPLSSWYSKSITNAGGHWPHRSRASSQAGESAAMELQAAAARSRSSSRREAMVMRRRLDEGQTR